MALDLILRELRPFEPCHFWQFFFLHCRVWSLCNQLLLQFSIYVSQTLQTNCGHIEDVYVGF